MSLLCCLRDGYFSCSLNAEVHQASRDNLVLGRVLVILLAAGLSAALRPLFMAARAISASIMPDLA